MKPEIHPQYMQSRVVCACGNTWTTGSTVPEIRIEVCNQCHPFFTGQQRIVDTLGRVERLRRRYAAGSDQPASETQAVQAAGQETTRDPSGDSE